MEENAIWRQLYLHFNSVEIRRSVRLLNTKLAMLRISLLLGLLMFVLWKVLQGCLYEQVVADHWILGDLQTLRRPREEFRNETDTRMREPVCPRMVAERISLELEHVRRVYHWVDNQGIAMFTPAYIRDYCAEPPRHLGRFQYGAQVAGFLAETLEDTLAVLYEAQLQSPLYTVWLEAPAPAANASLFASTAVAKKTWWGPAADLETQAKAYFDYRKGHLHLVLSTGQYLWASFDEQYDTLTVRRRDGREVHADFLEGELRWKQANPYTDVSEEWRPLRELHSRTVSDMELRGLSNVAAVGLGDGSDLALWSKTSINKLIHVLESKPELKSITMVFQSMGAKPCLQRPPAVMAKDLGMHDTLITTLQEHWVYTAPRRPGQLSGGRPPEHHARFLGGQAFVDADSTVLRISFSPLRRQGNISGTLAACPLAGGGCTEAGEATVEFTEWEGQRQESILIPVAKLLDMQHLNLDSCSASDACTLLLVVEVSNTLEWKWLRAMREDDFGTMTFQVRVYKTSMAGSISDFRDLMDSESDCIHEVRHAGVRVHFRIEGLLHRWSSYSAAVAAGSFMGLLSVMDVVLAVCTIGFLGKLICGPQSLLYKAQAVHHVGKAGSSESLQLARERVEAQAAETGSRLDEWEIDTLLGIAPAKDALLPNSETHSSDG